MTKNSGSFYKEIINFWKNKSDLIIPIFLFFFTFLIYLHNISPSVYGGDAGDFLSAIAVRGVPHPSGYPLFMLLGILFSYLPVGQTLAFKVSLVSALFSSLSVILMYFIAKLLIRDRLLAVTTALFLAFIYIFWLYAEIAEVFALTYFFFLLLLYLGLLYWYKKNKKILYVLFFSTGLSLSNHELVVSVFPSLAILIFAANWKIIFDIKTILKCLLFFILGLTPYIYIPIAASRLPPVNWDQAYNLENFLHLIFRKDYSWGSYKITVDSSLINLRFLGIKSYLNDLTEITPAALITIFLGMIYMLKLKKIIVFIAIFLVFFLTGPFFIYYGFVPNIAPYTTGILERFYMVSILFLVPFFPFGIKLITGLVEKLLKNLPIESYRLATYQTVFSLVFLTIPVSLFFINFPKTDLHEVWMGDFLAEDILNTLPTNSVVFIAGDTPGFNMLYLQHARGIRKDITVIGTGAPDNNPEYLERETKILKKITKEEKFAEVFFDLINEERPVFSNSSILLKSDSHQDLFWIPYGTLLKAVAKDEKDISADKFLNSQNNFWKSYRFKSYNNLNKAEKRSLSLYSVQSFYYSGAISTAGYLIRNYNELEEAKKYYQIAEEINPFQLESAKGIGYYYLQKKDCKNAEKLFLDVFSQNPTDKDAHVFLYDIYANCLGNNDKAKLIENSYYSIYKKSIPKDIDSEKNRI